MEESILLSIKQMLGLEADYAPFDQELLVHINSALFTLMQLGVGPSDGFDVNGADETWGDFLGDQLKQLKAVKSYIYYDVRLAWDPPSSATVAKQFQDKHEELGWRLRHQIEAGDTE